MARIKLSTQLFKDIEIMNMLARHFGMLYIENIGAYDCEVSFISDKYDEGEYITPTMKTDQDTGQISIIKEN